MTAAIDGPTTRAAFMLTLFSVMALLTSSGPTSSSTKVRRAGVSTTATKPSPMATANTIQSCTAPVTVSSPSSSARDAAAIWVAISSLRVSKRSTTTPPSGPKKVTGRNWQAVTRPSSVLLPVSCSTSQPWATVCIQVPASETAWPPK